ncbi:aminoglycoside phosphotransferase family protein [Amycolatopsis cihanbeyliensis]|uniref:Streptomycin 6-kinase n=1 Tax=Amycolatopsis cihanbeyliensis TaxID=1128664 RepID=A0A542DPD3_AMYCI|nr:aminoglycoside phosphotransferase family protein [Amycolatopsis cihanbeyliensis]TQJ04835.1 streptomycin 6-kinase [Amycolatopsis cihanbeyliensis]
MTELIVPPAFAERVGAMAGDRGRAWLAELPGVAARYHRAWSLTPDGPTMHGYTGVVQPVTRAGGGRAVLKICWRDEETRDEPVALTAWDGAGAVRLLDGDPEHGVLLLERLDAGRALDGEPIGVAVAVAGGLLRRLSVAAPPLHRTLRAEAARWAAELPTDWERLGRPLPRALLDAAVAICRVRGPRAGALLVNEDLHYENVLRGGREPWLVIDPKPIAGDPEFGVIPLLWNRMGETTLDERFAALVAAARLDPARARDWTLVRAVLNWLWAVEDEEEGGWLHTAVVRIAEWAFAR